MGGRAPPRSGQRQKGRLAHGSWAVFRGCSGAGEKMPIDERLKGPRARKISHHLRPILTDLLPRASHCPAVHLVLSGRVIILSLQKTRMQKQWTPPAVATARTVAPEPHGTAQLHGLPFCRRPLRGAATRSPPRRRRARRVCCVRSLRGPSLRVRAPSLIARADAVLGVRRPRPPPRQPQVPDVFVLRLARDRQGAADRVAPDQLWVHGH